jgi:hypothetical protein
MSEEIYPTNQNSHYSQSAPPPIKPWRESITPQPRNNLPSLEEILTHQTDFPTRSLLLGLSEELRPLILDLERDPISAVLIASDCGFDNTILLHNLLTAALKKIHPQALHLHLISPHADDLLHFRRNPNCRIGYQPFDPEVPIVLEEMVNLVISRQHTLSHRASHIFAIDGLDLLWQSIDPQSKLRLDWLIRNGPDAGFLPIATLDTTYLSRDLTRSIDLFPSRILGPISQANIARFLSGLSRSHLSDLSPGQEFLLITHGQACQLQMVSSLDLTEPYLVGREK